MASLSFFGRIASILLLATCSGALAAPAGAPGLRPFHWAPALKQAVGTSYEATSAQSPVWFTLAEGVVTEVFYPTIDQAQVGDLQFLVTDGKSFFSEQKRDVLSEVSYLDEGMTVRVSGTDKTGSYRIEQEIVTDTAAPVLRIRTKFIWLKPGLRLFVLFKPAIGNSHTQTIAMATNDGLYATRHVDGLHRKNQSTRMSQPLHATLLISSPWKETSTGYVGFSDGWQDVSRNFQITQNHPEAGPGNVALVGEVLMRSGPEFTLDMALGFGSSQKEAVTYSKTSLTVPFEKARQSYEQGWLGFLQGLANSKLPGERRFMAESTFARRSAQIIKMHEDKVNRGAMVASLSKPGVPDSERAIDGVGGYHLVWPRDLYHSAMGLLAAGDTRTPIDTLNYLARNQRPDGSWPQNFWIDGSPYWRGVQMDEIAFPIMLAAQVKRRIPSYVPSPEILEMVRRASSFIISHGPATQQDRWEEIGGYIPSTLAAEIAALKLATALTGDGLPAVVANQWNSMIESWTLVTNGPHGRNYYLRTSPNGTPDSPEAIGIANGGGHALAYEILDGGFLELVRYGVRDAFDPRIQSTLQIYESQHLGIAGSHPSIQNAMTYRRYNRDAYGPLRVGGYWPLLAGERGHYAVAAKDWDRARAQLFILESSALPSGVLPEQTMTAPSPGAVAGLGVATPLVWAHAEDILLHRSLEEGRIFDTPQYPAPPPAR